MPLHDLHRLTTSPSALVRAIVYLLLRHQRLEHELASLARTAPVDEFRSSTDHTLHLSTNALPWTPASELPSIPGRAPSHLRSATFSPVWRIFEEYGVPDPTMLNRNKTARFRSARREYERRYYKKNRHTLLLKDALRRLRKTGKTVEE